MLVRLGEFYLPQQVVLLQIFKKFSPNIPC